MLTANNLLKQAADSIKAGHKYLDADRGMESVILAEISSLRSTVYTMAAEIIGRMDADREGHDSKLNEEGAGTTNGAQGD